MPSFVLFLSKQEGQLLEIKLIGIDLSFGSPQFCDIFLMNMREQFVSFPTVDKETQFFILVG